MVADDCRVDRLQARCEAEPLIITIWADSETSALEALDAIDFTLSHLTDRLEWAFNREPSPATTDTEEARPARVVCYTDGARLIRPLPIQEEPPCQ